MALLNVGDVIEAIPFELSEDNPHGPVISIAPPEAPKPLTDDEKVKWVALTGSRSHWQWELIMAICAMATEKFPNARFLVGDAFGFDRMARLIIDKHLNRKLVEMDAKWKVIGNGAGFSRNWEMAIKADVVIGLWDGVSRGTKHTLDAAKQLGKRIIVWEVPAIPNPNPKFQR
jgi:hypothetical protein